MRELFLAATLFGAGAILLTLTLLTGDLQRRRQQALRQWQRRRFLAAADQVEALKLALAPPERLQLEDQPVEALSAEEADDIDARDAIRQTIEELLEAEA